MTSIPTFPVGLAAVSGVSDKTVHSVLQPVDPIVESKQILLQLQPLARQQLLRECFAEELKQLTYAEGQKGYQAGLLKGQTEATELLQAELNQLKEAVITEKDQLLLLIQELKKKDFKILCEQLPQILLWSAAAIEKVLLHECRDQAYLQATLEEMMVLTTQQSGLHLYCCQDDLACLQHLLADDSRFTDISADPKLAQGQLSLGTGAICSTSLQQRLTQLVSVFEQMAVAAND